MCRCLEIVCRFGVFVCFIYVGVLFVVGACFECCLTCGWFSFVVMLLLVLGCLIICN